MSHLAKFGRAQEHFIAIKTAIERFLAVKPYRLIEEYQPPPPFNQGDSVDFVLRLRILGSIPVEVPSLIGDYLTNLRASLDHLIYDIAVRHMRGNLTEERWLQFVIVDNPATFASSLGKFKQDLPRDVVIAMESLQPYTRCHGAKDPDQCIASDPLWLLNLLVNTDKHRTFLTVTHATFRDIRVDVEGGRTVNGLSGHTASGPFQHGAEIHTLSFTAYRPEAEVKVNFEPTVQVAFGEEWPTLGRPVLMTLEKLRDHVRDVVFPALEPFL